jgi:hypothetical protein
LSQTENPATGNKLPRNLENRLSLEFHLWSGTAEGVTEGSTIYTGTFTDPRRDAARLHGLCIEIAGHLGPELPEGTGTLLLAGRLYRRSADYVKACEYFHKVLALVRSNSAQGGCPCV